MSASDDGLTIVELLVSMVIFALISAAVIANLGLGLTLSRTDRQRSVAANLAAQDLDAVRNLGVTALPLGQTNTTATVDATTYTVERTTEWVTKDATSGACDGGAGARQAYVRVNVQVSWPQMAGVLPVQSDTLIYPKAGSTNPNTGGISIKVRDRTAQPQTNVLAKVTGPGGTFSQFTADDGCAFFPFLLPGTYTGTVSSAGYVDLVGNSAPSVQLGVTIGATTATAFDYDRAASLLVTLAGPTASYPPVPGLPVRLGNANGAFPYGVTQAYPAGSATSNAPILATPLFPFTSGYTGWAGDCADSDPGVSNRGQFFATGPAAAGAGTVTMDGIDATVYTLAIVPRPNQVVSVTATHPADTAPQGCSTSRSYSYTGTTDANAVLRFALPFGTWKVSVTGSIYIATVVVTPGGPSVVATQIG